MAAQNSRTKSNLVRYAPHVFLAIEVLLFYRAVLISQRRIIPWDLVDYNLPHVTYISTSLRHATLPLWDPNTYCGFPFFANIQAQLFYVPTIFAVVASGFATGRALVQAMEWQFAAHIYFAGLGAYWLLRRLGTGRAAATLGGTVFQLGSFFVSVSALGPADGGAWLPFAWLAVVALREELRLRWAALLALSFAMAILAGFPAITMVVFGFTLLLAISFVVIERRSLKLIAAVLISMAWGVALASVQLFPTIQLMMQGETLGRGSFPPSGSPLISLVTMVAPNHYHELSMDSGYHLSANPAFVYLYCGIPGLILALAAMLFRRTRLVAVFTFITLASLVWMLGSSTPIGTALWNILPALIKAPIYLEFTKLSFVLGLAVLAGLGLEISPLRRWRLARIALVVVAAADLILVASNRKLDMDRVSEHAINSPAEFEGSTQTVTEIRKLVNETNPPARIEAVEDSDRWPFIGLSARIPTATGDDPLALSRLLAVRRLFAEGPWWVRRLLAVKIDSPIASLLNLRYFVSWRPGGPEPVRKAGFQQVLAVSAHQVYENPKALPRFFLVPQIHAADKLADAIAFMASPDFDPRRAATVEGAPKILDQVSVVPPLDAVKVKYYGERRLLLEVESRSNDFLVTSEVLYPGWKAYVDGHPQKMYMTNGAFRGLFVAPGRHEIEMRFQPEILWYSMALAALAWSVLILAAFQRRFAERRLL